MWFKKNDTNAHPLHSEEYDECLKRILKLNTDVELLKSNFEAHKLQLDTLRGNFSRKLKGMKEEEEKKTETVNNDNLVAFG